MKHLFIRVVIAILNKMTKYKITSIEYGEQLTKVTGEPWKTIIQIEDKPNVDISMLIWDKTWAEVVDERELELTNDPKYGPQARLIKKASKANTEIANKLKDLEARVSKLEGGSANDVPFN